MSDAPERALVKGRWYIRADLIPHMLKSCTCSEYEKRLAKAVGALRQIMDADCEAVPPMNDSCMCSSCLARRALAELEADDD